jgi:ubiquinone/menaquinone biosynthesis C-methylase UbiE
MDSQAIAEQNQKAYNVLAVSYAKQWVKKPDIQLAEQFLTILNGNHILDVGCGPGHYSSYFIDRGCRVEAIDTSSEMLRLAGERDPRIRTRMLDMTKLDYDEGQFDGLWVCASLPHIPKELVGAVLRDFRRVLKRDGCLFVNAIIGKLDHRIETPQEMGPNFCESGRFFQWYPSTDRFKEILEQSGFGVLADWQRQITSQVLKDALLPTNLWCNCFCRVEG